MASLHAESSNLLRLKVHTVYQTYKQYIEQWYLAKLVKLAKLSGKPHAKTGETTSTLSCKSESKKAVDYMRQALLLCYPKVCTCGRDRASASLLRTPEICVALKTIL